MKFIDSNIFLHAFLTPRRTLTKEEEYIKDQAKAIIQRIEEGEDVATTTVHLSEVVNIIENGLSLQKSLSLLAWIITSENIKIYPVAVEDYESATPLAEDKNISANDALAYLSMRRHGLKEIYSFDRHFNQLKDISIYINKHIHNLNDHNYSHRRLGPNNIGNICGSNPHSGSTTSSLDTKKT